MAILTHSALFTATIYKWQTDKPEGGNRVRDAKNGTSYLLNTNRLDGLRETSETLRTSLYYFDNPLDYRDNSHYMVVGKPIFDVGQTTGLISAMDVTPTHTHMSLSIFPDMDHSKSPVATVINIENFSFAVAVTDAHSATQSYVWYVDSAWRIVRCRVNQSLAQLLALVQP
jgi:hypothetical protein